MIGRLESVNTSRGGVPKTSMLEALITPYGVSGDSQHDVADHGGPDRAVVLFSLEVIRDLQAEGHAVAPGTTGENLTVSGLDWASLGPGTRIRVGGVRLERGDSVAGEEEDVPRDAVGERHVDRDLVGRAEVA